MAIRPGFGLATVIAAVSLAAPGSSAGTVSSCQAVTVGSAVVRSECSASAGTVAAGTVAAGTVARTGEGAGDVVDVLGDILAGLPSLTDRVAQAIPARQFGSWILLMHF